MTSVDLGCGLQKSHEMWGLDMRPLPGVDIVADLEGPYLPFADNSLDFVKAFHIMEHIGDGFIDLMDDLWRCVKPDGILEIRVPRFPHVSAIMNPDHKRFFVMESFSFFLVPSGGHDRHGYLKGFWHIVRIGEDDRQEELQCAYTPNKLGITRYPYVETSYY